MDSQATGRFGDIAAAVIENPVDMLPFRTRQRGSLRMFRVRLGGVLFAALECGHDLVGVDRFRQETGGPQPHRRHRSGDTAVPGEDDGSRGGIDGQQFFQHVQARFSRHAEVNDGQFGGFAARLVDGLVAVGGQSHVKPAVVQSTAQADAKHLIVVDDQDTGTTFRPVGRFTHAVLPENRRSVARSRYRTPPAGAVKMVLRGPPQRFISPCGVAAIPSLDPNIGAVGGMPPSAPCEESLPMRTVLLCVGSALLGAALVATSGDRSVGPVAFAQARRPPVTPGKSATPPRLTPPAPPAEENLDLFAPPAR